MKHNILKISLLNAFIISLFFTGYTQGKSNKQLLVEDFNTYITYIEQTHPDPYSAYSGRIEFKRTAQNIRNKITETTTKEQFAEMLSGFISQLGDGHTMINLHENELDNNPSKQLPFKLKIATDGLFISQTNKEYNDYLGGKVLSINSIPIDSLLEKTRILRPTENKYGEYFELCDILSNEKNTNLLLGETGRLKLIIQLTKGNQQTLNITYVEYSDWVTTDSKIKLKKDNNLLYSQILDNKQPVGYFVWNGMYSREMVEEVAKNNPQGLDMNLNSMYKHSMKVPRPQNNDEALKGIPSLYDTFSELLNNMKSQKVGYLIIDLRGNGGGQTPLCYPLLYMLYGDKYLNYDCKGEYDRIFSPLLLKKWGLQSIEQYNTGNNTSYQLGDFMFGHLLWRDNKETIEEKRKNQRLTTYYGIGQGYTEDLNGVPIYEPHVVVLCSPKTFSAAYHFMYFLTEIGHKNVTIVGVPSRQAGNTFMETTSFELPNTKITGSISNALQILYSNNSANRKVLMPDFAMNWSDYANYNFDENAEIMYVLDLINQKKIAK